MSVGDQLRDPWGWLVAGVTGGLAGAVLAAFLMPWAAVAAGVGIVVLGTRVAVGVRSDRRGRGGRGQLAAPARDRLPPAPRDSRQASLVVRSRAAVDRLGDLVDRPSDPWIAGEVAQVLTSSGPVVEAVAEMAGRVTLLDSSIRHARPDELAREIGALQEQLRRTADADVRRERQRALSALDAQADAVDRLLARRDTALAQMQTSTVGLEGLATRTGELVALGSAAQDTDEAARIVADLIDVLDSVRAGVDEARDVLRDL
ncbi:MAG: hypothetical protein WCF36_20825 [Candidatus Nanopelagicales bacterium]